MTDHLAKAKDYIAKGDDYYAKAADEIAAARSEGWTIPSIARELGRSTSWVDRLIAAAKTHTARDADGPFVVDHQSGTNRRDEVAARVLRDPEQRREALSSLPPEQVEAVIEAGRDVLLGRADARRDEHAEDRHEIRNEFQPGNLWADNLIVRLHNNALELRSWIQRKGGLLLNMEPRQAVDYLLEVEQLVADVRAAAQEQVQDRSEVG